MGNDHELASNRKAYFNYEIIENFEAGIILQGTEVKSLKEGGGNLQDGYVVIKSDELWLIQVSIAPYRFGNIHNHEEKRERKLLMHKKEILKLERLMQEKSLTLIPLSIYLNKGKIKVKLGLAKGKKKYDKRQAIHEREEKRDLARALKR